MLNVPFNVQNPIILFVVGNGTYRFAKKSNCHHKKGTTFPFAKKFISQSPSSRPKPVPKKAKIIPLWLNRVDSLLVKRVNEKFNFRLIFYTFSLH